MQSKMHHALTHEDGALARLAAIDHDIANALNAFGPPRHHA